VNFLLDGLKIVKGSIYLGRKHLHNNHAIYICVLMNIIRYFNGYIPLLHVSRGAETISKVKGVFIK
jgi:hypothetical protein